jgi:hypothetical protein
MQPQEWRSKTSNASKRDKNGKPINNKTQSAFRPNKLAVYVRHGLLIQFLD